MRPCDISSILGRLEADELNSIDSQVREVVRGVEQTGLQGEINLKIKLKKSGSNSLMIGTELKTKVPRPAAGQRVAYFGYDDTNQATGTIADLPPRQEPLFDKDSNVKSIHRNKN